MVISRRLFHLQTSYLVPSYNPIRCIQWPKCRWPWPKWVKKPKNCSYLGGYFTSYLLSQLFVSHLGVALLFYFIMITWSSISSISTVKPVAPVISITPNATVEIYDQNSVSLTCGNLVPSTISSSYNWMKNGVKVSNQSNRVYTFSSVTFSDGGDYTCNVTISPFTSDTSQPVSFEGMFAITIPFIYIYITKEEIPIIY